MNRPTFEDRFWAKVDRHGPIPAHRSDLGPCWLWVACRYPNGYGQFEKRLVHRIAYELLIGPIPAGLDLDHLCRVRHCACPWHVEPVTRRVNILRGASHVASRARQTHCKRGHPLDATNTAYRWNGRECRTCKRASTRAWAARNRAGQTIKKRERRQRNRLVRLGATA